MDRWVVSATQTLIKLFRKEMDAYKLFKVVTPLLNYLEELTNWYIKLNRTKRMKGDLGEEEQKTSLSILFDCVLNITTLMACLTPFLTEHIYQNLRNGIDPNNKDLYQESVHFLQIPQHDESLMNPVIERKFSKMQSAIRLGRLIRERQNIKSNTPLSKVTIVDLNAEAR